MEEIVTYKNYQEFKQQLDNNLKRQAADFVEAGYLLKIARDSDILAESGYKNVAEFAKSEYGFGKDVVSRYIGINDRFSEGGYSLTLKPEFTDFGFTKLSEMLTLPDTIIEEIEPSLTRKQIQEVKTEIKEETKVSDIEVLCETSEKEFENNMYAFLYYFLKDKKEIFEKLSVATSRARQFEILVPTGAAMLMTRIPKQGKYMLKLTDPESDVTLTNIRTGEKETYTSNYLEVAIATSVFQKNWNIEYPSEEPEKIDEAVKETVTEITEPVPEEITSGQILGSGPSERTEEQKYNSEQNKIDKQTKEVLEEREAEEKMAILPSEQPKKIHEIKLAAEYYEDVLNKRKTFELRKNDRDYKVGDYLKLIEYAAGSETGRFINAEIIYMLEDYTGLTEGYCILGIDVGRIEVNE